MSDRKNIPPLNYLIVISGPTAVGKTEVSINLAQYFDTEIVSADSRQFFKEMNIGTAKPSAEELRKVKHHLVNSHSIFDPYNTAQFEKDALSALTDIYSKKTIAILCGGTGLYIRTLLCGIDEIPQAGEEIRTALTKQLEEQGIEKLGEQLKKLDPLYYSDADGNNPQRIIRALEVCLASGKPYSSFLKNKQVSRNFIPLKIGLDMDRKLLYQRIDERVDRMFAAGLEQEARTMIKEKGRNALQTVGYREFFDHFEGKMDILQTLEKIKQNTRNYAKRQLTWFRKDKEIQWFHPRQEEEIIRYLEEQMKKRQNVSHT